MILMPYNPYPIDPFFMPPDGVGETDEGEQQQQPDEKATTEADEKEPNEQENEATNHNVSWNIYYDKISIFGFAI